MNKTKGLCIVKGRMLGIVGNRFLGIIKSRVSGIAEMKVLSTGSTFLILNNVIELQHQI